MAERTKDQQTEFKFSTDWSFLKIQNQLFDQGFVAEMGPAAFCVLCILRKSTNPYKKGPESWSALSHQKIAEMMGVTAQTVKKSIKALEKKGWLKKHPRGKGYAYELTQKLVAMSLDEAAADRLLMMPYEPSTMKLREKETSMFDRTGRLPEGSPILIQKIEINNPQIQIINNAEGSSSVNIQASMEEIQAMKLPKHIKDNLITTLERKLIEGAKELSQGLDSTDKGNQ